ncbi:MAG: MHYT domain-containing protein [Pseudomonadota bacterium]
MAHDPILTFISVLVAIVGARSGLAIMEDGGRLATLNYKSRLLLCAIVLGGAIWTMHFVGMHAIRLTTPISYAVLPTFVSALVAIVMTGVGLYVATAGVLRAHARKYGAICMGCGVTGMHYLGMSAIRGGYTAESGWGGALLALSVGIVVSWIALRAFTAPRTSNFQSLWAATLIGVAISAIHYIAMADTQFTPVSTANESIEPVISQYYIASVAAFCAFLIVDLFILFALPEPRRESATSRPEAASASAIEGEKSVALDAATGKVVVSCDLIVSVKADGHYCAVTLADRTAAARTVFSSVSLARLIEKLPADQFLRVHRSHLVNAGRIERLERSSSGVRLVMSNGGGVETEVPVGRSYLKVVDERLARSDRL